MFGIPVSTNITHMKQHIISLGQPLQSERMSLSGSPQPELHHVLRRAEFPQSAKDALACLGIDFFLKTKSSHLHKFILSLHRTTLLTSGPHTTSYF